MQVTWSLVAGGAETYALTVLSHLDERRWAPSICAVDQGGALEPEFQRRGIPCWIMNRRPRVDWALMWRMYRLFREAKVDVVQTHHFNQLFYSIPGALLTGARIIHTEHSIECYKRRKLRLALMGLSLFCRKVVAIGTDGATVLRKQVGIPARKLQIIRAGVDVDSFRGSRREARQRLGLGQQDQVVAIIARLYPEKNHLLLLHAFARVLTMLPNARLLIAGGGTEEQAIRDRIAQLGVGQRVQVMGVRRDVGCILAACDVFCLCSDREGLPIAVLEAMAASRPVVATAVGDLPTVVLDGQTGRLVPPRNADVLAAALIEVLSDPRRAAAMGRRGRQVVRSDYGVDAMVAQYESLYDGADGISRKRRCMQ